MTEPQRPPISPPPPLPVPPAPSSSPGMRPPAPGAVGQERQHMPSQTLEIASGQNRPNAATSPLPAAKTPPAAPPPSGQRLSAPPPTTTRMPPRGAGPSPGHPTLSRLVHEAHEKGFSDIHVGIGEEPRFRNRGEIETTNYPVTDEQTFMSWLREVLSDEEIRRFQENLDFDGATQYNFARVRINIFDSLTGPAMVMRLIPLKITTLEQLRLPLVLKDVCHQNKGLILVTGPTGSGKSTTLAAMIDYINNEMPKHIITIEDPVEFVHKSRKSLIRHREVGMHTLKFDNALKAALREDPDVILIGEMRDKETVNTALKAAQTGHLVMGTLHTNSAVKTIERILTLYSPEEQPAMRVAIAESLVAVISQGLCRTTDGKRAAFHDILINTETVKDYIRKGQNDEITEIMSSSDFDSMITMNKSLFHLYQEGRITEETALEMSPTPNEMAMMLRGRV